MDHSRRPGPACRTGDRSPLLALSLLLASGLLGCASLPETVAFRIPEENFRSKVHTLCIAPIASELGLAEFEDRAAQFEHFIGHNLKLAGFAVVAARSTEEAREAILEQGLGGCYDEFTGEANVALCDERRAQLRAALHDQLGCDAILHSRIALATAHFDESYPRWDGRTHSLWPVQAIVGYVGSTSLWIQINGIEDGEELYWRSAGIEILMKMTKDFGPRFDPVPDDRILINPVQNMTAVLSSLAPLLGPLPSDTKHCRRRYRTDFKEIMSSSRLRMSFPEPDTWLALCELELHPPGPPLARVRDAEAREGPKLDSQPEIDGSSASKEDD